MTDRELGNAGHFLLAAIILGLLLALSGCAQQKPLPAPDPDVPNVLERCKVKCGIKGKVPIAACEDETTYRCLCEPDSA